jgi:hypothetical protein
MSWEAKPLMLGGGEFFFVERARVDLVPLRTISADEFREIDSVLQYCLSFEVADADAERFRAWTDARVGRSIVMLTGGVPFSVAILHSTITQPSFALNGPGEAGWTQAEAVAIASSLCP